MNCPRLTILLLMGIIRSTCMYGQFYTTGEAPASIKWNKISTAHFNIIFPEGLSREANKMANRLEYFMIPGSRDYNYRLKKKLPVLLHSSSVISNGYVTLAPGRMELVTTPPQDSYAQDWITQLALHEYRHVAQLGSLNRGFTRILSAFTGEIATGSISALMPAWFYEGDAVYNETRLSASGRGRMPGFEMSLRTLLLERERNFSYDKAIFGSYRDFVPDHYSYGYQMVGYARSKFGKDLWPKALDYTSGHPYFAWPLAFYLKKNSGFYKSGIYKLTVDSLKHQYNNQKEKITYIDYSPVSRRNKSVFTNYKLPKDPGNGNIVALRTGMDDPDSYVLIDSSGKEEKLFVTGASSGLKNDLYMGRLIWDEVVPDPRWERRDYSVIKMVDLESGRPHALTKKSRYFSPDFSPDGEQIAVIETDILNHHFITVLDAHTGASTKQIPAVGNKALQFPEWIGDHEILVITVSDKGKQMEVYNLIEEKWAVLFPNTTNDISEPLNYKNYILFRASFNGLENIYAVSKTNTTKLYQVTFSNYGAYHPALSNDGQQLLFSDYGPDGFDISFVMLDTTKWEISENTTLPQPRWQENSTGITESIPSPDSIPGVKYEEEPYRKLAHLIHIHSWLPFYTDWEEAEDDLTKLPIYPGFILYSQNLLSTVISSVGYRYTNGYHEFLPSISWRGWYPVIELSGKFGGPARALTLPEGVELPRHASTYHEINLKAYVPLYFSRGKNITILQPSAEYQQTATWYYSGGGLHKGIDFLHFRMNMNHYSRFSKRDLYPRWGQFISATYTQTPVDNRQFGNLFSTQAIFFVPGLWNHHHFYVKAGIQIQRPEKYYIPLNRIDFPRGIPAAVSEEFTTLGFNYSFPAGYPDLAIGPLLYLKRFRINLFYDWSYGVSIKERNVSGITDFTGSYRSFGTEILADMHLIRIIFPIAAGVRLGYIPGKQQLFSELLIQVDTGIF